MGAVLKRASAACCAFVFATSFAGAGDRPHTRYPNELQGFRFYSKYLAPLQPGLSGEDAVRRVFGDTAAVKRNGWSMIPTYTMKSGPVYNPTLRPLYQIIVRPDGVIPMGAVKFSEAFTLCHDSLSEINIGFDVYSDRFGLEYWLHEEDSEWGKKGDLYGIIYGERRRPYPPNTICG
jgi:hypothetical protein